MITVYGATVVIFSLYLIYEYTSLKNAINSIPIRIFVNGTRGKSTTVQILHKILKSNGQKVYAKTTGDKPVIINPNGTQSIIKRFAPTSIIENIKILKRISKEKPDAFIMECMALQPETQTMLGRIFKANHTIISNVHNDHEEVMGRNLKENLITIFQCVHDNSKVYATEEVSNYLKTFDVPINNNTVVSNTSSSYLSNNIPQEIINESWAIINEICTNLLIENNLTQTIFNEKWENIDNSIRKQTIKDNISIWNLFSVNDIETADKFLKFVNEKAPGKKNKIFFLNCRIDRPIRTLKFSKYLMENFNSAEIWLIGEGKKLAKQTFKKQESVHFLSKKKAFETIQSGEKSDTDIFCIGNHEGMDEFLLSLESLSSNEWRII